MAARSFQVSAGRLTSSGFNYIYTCPTAHVVIVKSQSVRNAGGSSMVMAFGGLQSGSSNGCNFVDWLGGSALPAGASSMVQGWWVLEPGDELFYWLNASGTIDYWVSGTLLS